MDGDFHTPSLARLDCVKNISSTQGKVYLAFLQGPIRDNLTARIRQMYGVGFWTRGKPNLVRRMVGYRSLNRPKIFRLWLNDNQDRLLDFSPGRGEAQRDCQSHLLTQRSLMAHGCPPSAGIAFKLYLTGQIVATNRRFHV